MSAEQIPQGAEVSIFSKNEKKARAAIAKLNLKPVKGITRVTFKKKGNQIYAIENPDVYKSAAGTFIVFGEAKLEDFAQRLQQAQAQAQAQGINPVEGTHDQSSIQADFQAAANANAAKIQEEEDPNEVVDESGLKPEDIELIVEQTGASRAKAVKALRAHDSDLVNAIMELSS
ncbi:hypothetical protein WICPIJ_004948 [Wickerhamomyces pijperi]|uniref:Nascent polypeptide-associated complex subunit alpha n=1 Tax=Wickerhamomyces pijperi TaxID=599730 RepID=A0A9P8Q4G8_WICPI|nr:hypothetical protein WICPIJ_004948 [Wickerhamomyces pijperi]